MNREQRLYSLGLPTWFRHQPKRRLEGDKLGKINLLKDERKGHIRRLELPQTSFSSARNGEPGSGRQTRSPSPENAHAWPPASPPLSRWCAHRCGGEAAGPAPPQAGWRAAAPAPASPRSAPSYGCRVEATGERAPVAAGTPPAGLRRPGNGTAGNAGGTSPGRVGSRQGVEGSAEQLRRAAGSPGLWAAAPRPRRQPQEA